jgi:hypothetical protein
MLNMSKTDKKPEYKLIRITKGNWKRMCELGNTSDSFNDVLTRLLDRSED